MFTIGEKGQEYMTYTVSINPTTCTVTACPDTATTTAQTWRANETITADQMNQGLPVTITPKPNHWRCSYCENANPDNFMVCGENKFWGCGAPRNEKK